MRFNVSAEILAEAFCGLNMSSMFGDTGESYGTAGQLGLSRPF